MQPGPPPGRIACSRSAADADLKVEQRKLSYQFLRTSVVIKAAITMMRDTVIVIIWWTAKPGKTDPQKGAFHQSQEGNG